MGILTLNSTFRGKFFSKNVGQDLNFPRKKFRKTFGIEVQNIERQNVEIQIVDFKLYVCRYHYFPYPTLS
jgi:hypothetical protein